VSHETVRTSSENETIAFGEALARRLSAKALILLIGDLGAGKTTLTKGIVKGLGAAAPEEVSSPTFTLVHEYGERPKVYHVDLYRLRTLRDVASVGLEELLDREAIVLVEWGERFPELWPEQRIDIHLTWVDESTREIVIHARGQPAAQQATGNRR